MSPGYDFPTHWSFERPVKVACLNCHVGRVEPTGETVHKMTIHEQAIGCERCHGPGSLHAEMHHAKKHVPGAEDLTIVNPGKLSRPLLEAVCAECHLNGPAVVALRGRGPTDFRPGRPLSDYRTDYRYDSGSEQMTVVGHIEQLRNSVCYQKSDLTCITCHDPHARERPKDPVAMYRQKCLDCHSDKGCSLAETERRKKEPADNCSACHMPRGDTDIPHIAFTHHRIGKHGQRPAIDPQRVPELVPTGDVSHLSTIDRQRNLGLAYHFAAQSEERERNEIEFRRRALSLLETVHTSGLRDGAVATALAELHWKLDGPRARRYADEALGANDLVPENRAMALKLLANSDFDDRDFQSAIRRLEETVRLRRFADDWRLLGICYLLDNQPRLALKAMEQALAIRPFRHDIHGGMFEIYRRLGDTRRAQEHLDKAQWLERNGQE
jgi:hypothetical protein